MGTKAAQTALNGICPYFTMFPLEFPLNILKRRARLNECVLDPFCGRGTTNYAASILGLYSLGIDSSLIATAITEAKLVRVAASDIVAEARTILHEADANNVPQGEFWQWLYHPDVLIKLCRLRTALLDDCSSPTRIALRGIILGALHGPQQKTFQSYFSNQCPRTYAPKPNYAKNYWKSRNILPLRVDVDGIVERRAKRYYAYPPHGDGEVRLGDSREKTTFKAEDQRFNWVITSPPYYGMYTYIPDQWLRYWFLGGNDDVDYTIRKQMTHSSPESFVCDLHCVWNNTAEICKPSATLVVRFGGISKRQIDPLALLKSSFQDTAWSIKTIRSAGTALRGKRQADTFLRKRTKPLAEYDLWAKLA